MPKTRLKRKPPIAGEVPAPERVAPPSTENPTTPKTPRGRRDQRFVRDVLLRMGEGYVDMLDQLCDVNDRSRRIIIETLIHEAHQELQSDPSARITPL